MSDDIIRCEACNYDAKSKAFYIQHLKSEGHIRLAFVKMSEDNAKKSYKEAINKAKACVDKAEEKAEKAEKELAEFKIKYDELNAKNEQLTKDNTDINTKLTTLTTKLDTLSMTCSTLESENQSLKADKSEKSDTHSVASSQSSGGSPLVINNYSPHHEKYRTLLELLLGTKPIQYVLRGEPGYCEYNLLRAVYALSYNSIQIIPPHITTSNTTQRITLGVPTLCSSIRKGQVVPYVYYNKFHIYLNSAGRATSLCAWNGTSEYPLVVYPA